ncbi:MAG TPA: hypothetical protein VGB37_17450 [Candidatus Lokiarchaeia archaeon]
MKTEDKKRIEILHKKAKTLSEILYFTLTLSVVIYLILCIVAIFTTKQV